MKKNILILTLLLISLVAVVPFTNAEMAKSLKWVDHNANPRFAIYDPNTPADKGDDLVWDKETGLIWARNANLAGKALIWEDAINYCKELGLDNLKGWRLPTKEELSNLTDPSQGTPALPEGHPFVNVKYSYWTCTTHEDPALSDNAYYVHIGDGAVRPFAKVIQFYVLPVMEMDR